LGPFSLPPPHGNEVRLHLFFPPPSHCREIGKFLLRWLEEDSPFFPTFFLAWVFTSPPLCPFPILQLIQIPLSSTPLFSALKVGVSHSHRQVISPFFIFPSLLQQLVDVVLFSPPFLFVSANGGRVSPISFSSPTLEKVNGSFQLKKARGPFFLRRFCGHLSPFFPLFSPFLPLRRARPVPPPCVWKCGASSLKLAERLSFFFFFPFSLKRQGWFYVPRLSGFRYGHLFFFVPSLPLIYKENPPLFPAYDKRFFLLFTNLLFSNLSH